jgi:heme-degrading monooxygenase HmoA
MALGALASVFRRSLSSRRSNRARRILRLAYGRQEMHDGDSGKLMVGARARADLRLRYDDRTMMLIVFRSRLTAAAGSDYSAMSQAIKEHAQRFPGFVDIKSFTADDGERLTVVRWQDAATLQAWADDAKHVAAKNLGRAKWYEYYDLEVAEIVRTSQFRREAQTTI